MQYKQGKLEVKLGNKKIGNDTLIFNMGTAQECPSKKRGFCMLGSKCYALKAEKQYHKTVPAYRKRQEKYWKTHDKFEIATDLIHLLYNRKRGGMPLYKSVKYLRINESGDFWSQDCIDKLSYIAFCLRAELGIKTYTYTARKDLDFSNVAFRVHLSSWKQGNHGTTIAKKNPPKTMTESKTGDIYYRCPMDCRKCNLCKETNANVVFPLH